MTSEVIYNSIIITSILEFTDFFLSKSVKKKNVLERFKLKPHKDQKVVFVRCRITYVLI